MSTKTANAREHHLKCWSSIFTAVEQGLKPWEFRRNDRDYAVGDVLHLHEWNGHYTRGTLDNRMGKPLSFRVAYILHGGPWQQFTGPGRCRALAAPRHAAWRIFKMRGCSYPEIGRACKRDHSTIVSGVRSAERRAK